MTVYESDIICLSETYLDSSTPFDDDNLYILGYTLIHQDYPSNNKRISVGICYKNSLLLRVCDISILDKLKIGVKSELKTGVKFCVSLLFIDSQVKLKMTFCHFLRTLNKTWKSCQKRIHPCLQLLVIFMQNLEVGLAKNLIPLREFHQKIERLNLDYINIIK